MLYFKIYLTEINSAFKFEGTMILHFLLHFQVHADLWVIKETLPSSGKNKQGTLLQQSMRRRALQIFLRKEK